MSDTEAFPAELNEHLASRGPSHDPEYLNWRDAQVTASLEQARADPEKMIPEHEIWKRFGLEY